jgi:hypothetical protein
MISYAEAGDRVTLEMSLSDYGTLLMALGYALGCTGDREARVWLLQFVNEMNRTNPRFTPYEV